MMEPLQDTIAKLRGIIAGARSAVGFTGAGISTESGVPDFRSPDSPWMRHKPIPFDLFVSSAAARREAWRRKFAMDDLYRDATPNRGHRALASLVHAGKMAAVITQNIDGLHQASGIPAEQVVELHGNGTYARCLDCGMRHELQAIRTIFGQKGAAPVCDDCQGLLKSATISFGQAMPVDEMRKAQELAMTCDLFFVIGSSLVVHPAAGLPVLAKRNGAKVIILNRQETPLDEIADLVIHAEIGPVLEPFAL
ncbi:SIR2 family NAD-dependent protein deacylase [Microvirga flavescens]|uniref:SIR2 family NAD-dependent protein deacylase n=1 Tax=Microvirga flavescens TaxID=2249811 RepID=UPI000DD8B3AB|nr:Sir2 family NAD-dependent protein deacetylase [Microvirga flavescens]